VNFLENFSNSLAVSDNGEKFIDDQLHGIVCEVLKVFFNVAMSNKLKSSTVYYHTYIWKLDWKWNCNNFLYVQEDDKVFKSLIILLKEFVTMKCSTVEKEKEGLK